MLDLNPQILIQDGKKAFVVFTYDEFLQIQETLADHDDLQMLRAAKRAEKEEPTVGLEVLKEEYGLNG
ncbi:MAG: type II toxin-antitoxin system Phd/YefM family antitoxin [Chloroflexi bacterium]|nr:type II toxin-antitoxin system Phd/YefM family antitoxin [Chloroflexota bacterium]